MTGEEALAIVNRALKDAGCDYLDDLQADILRGSVGRPKKGYDEIAKENHIVEGHVKNTGSELWKLLSEVFGEKVKKNNVKSVLERHAEKLSAKNQLNHVAQSRQINRENINNPFQPVTGMIDRNELFFNREKEIRKIFDLLNGGSGVELLGERKIGKSSVLWQVKERALIELNDFRRVMYLNLQNLRSENELYEAICDELEIESCNGYQFMRAIKQHRIVLLLDEAEKLTWEGFTRNIRDHLRGLAEGTNAPFRLVIAARTPLNDLFDDSEEKGMTSPFQGVCLRVQLLPWDRGKVEKFIKERLSGTLVSFNDAQIDDLWQESQGYPQYLMQSCFELYRKLYEIDATL